MTNEETKFRDALSTAAAKRMAASAPTVSMDRK